MGRRNGPVADWRVIAGQPDEPLRVSAGAKRTLARSLAIKLGLGLLLSTAVLPAIAQTMSERMANPVGQNRDRLLVQASEMVYDAKTDTIGARGNVQLYFQGRVLEADRVNYDRKASRVYAEGRVRITETDGSKLYGERLELTDDFKTGFIDSLKADTSEKTFMSAARAERYDGETTVFERGVYTACEACKDDPRKPPLWQVRAKRIIHQSEEETLYYEEATLELFGMPVAYLPFFSSPDPSVKRKSGWLAPTYVVKDSLGYGVSAPYFWAITPSMDMTLRPTILSRQGLLMDTEFRQRLVTGSYSIRATGILQADPTAFAAAPYGAGSRRFRGSVDLTGEFYLNEKWRFGWDVGFATDKYFTTDYRQPNQQLSTNYFRERTSQVYLTGQDKRGYFDLRGYYFQGLSAQDRQEQQPFVAPVLDYSKRFDISRERGIGGEVEIGLNLTTISRQAAAYESTRSFQLDPTYNLYPVCSSYDRGNCLLRGMAGEYTRATVTTSWRRQLIDNIGQVWTPFTFASLNGSWLSLDKTGTYYAGGAILSRNSDQVNFVGSEPDSFRGRFLAGTGLDYRLPMMARGAGMTHVIEPIAQIILRPDEVTNRSLVNEDAQSLVFDDSNLFAWSKFSGYDRFEGGVRTNYGVQYTAQLDNGGYANLLVGQSYQLAGRNSYASPDAANVGLSSGLDTKHSDFVTRAAFSPNGRYSFVAKGRFDPNDYHLRRLDLMANGRWGDFSGSLQYARYEAQPLLGYEKRREGLSAGSRYNFDKNFFAVGNVIFDMSRHLYTSTTAQSRPLFSVAGLSLGGGYSDECTTLTVNYTSTFPQSLNGAPTTRNQTVLLQLQLRTLGEARLSTSLSGLMGQDGVGSH